MAISPDDLTVFGAHPPRSRLLEKRAAKVVIDLRRLIPTLRLRRGRLTPTGSHLLAHATGE
jgi:hypothetical protein